jgi:hypothetical protein
MEIAIHNAQDENRHARMRLARNQVLGMRQYLADDANYMKRAYQRFLHICRPPKGHEKHIFDNMVSLLTEARVTINFSAGTFFMEECPYDDYINCFERTARGLAPSHALRQRDTVEKRIFDYRGRDGYVPPPARDRNAYRARKQIEHYAANWKSYPMMRPRYGALDFAYCTNGGVGSEYYGKSFFALKHHMKTVSSYLPLDSFFIDRDFAQRRAEYGGVAPTAHQAMALFHEMPKVLYYCHPFMLKQIYRYGSGRAKRGSEPCLPGIHDGKLNYIECQMQSDVLFSRDVDRMVISHSDMIRAVATFRNKGYTAYQMRKFAERFAHRHGFPVSFVA